MPKDARLKKASAKPSLPDDGSAHLISWARQRGAEWSSSLDVKDGARGRGVFANRPIRPGDLLLRLPTSLAVRPSGRLADLVAQGECSNLLALVLTVMHELFVRAPRLPFFHLLATSPPPGCPLLWSGTDDGCWP